MDLSPGNIELQYYLFRLGVACGEGRVTDEIYTFFQNCEQYPSYNVHHNLVSVRILEEKDFDLV